MPSPKNSFSTLAFGLLLLGAATSVAAQEKNWSISLGLKVWLNQWETWTDTSNGGFNIISETSKVRPAPIPSVAFRYKDFFVSSSYFAKTNYKFPTYDESNGAGGFVTTTFEADRKEFDLNLGWFFVPRVAATLGLKQVHQDFIFGSGSNVEFRYTMPIIGIVASAPVSDRFALYGTAAWGPKVTTAIDGNRQSSFSGSYSASEFGLAWLIARNFSMTLGYKYQIIQNKRDSSNSVFAGLVLRDVTDGWALGGQVNF